ncbi:MAG: alpha/beta fold hydrolase [Steroidobacteraceae bacterium]
MSTMVVYVHGLWLTGIEGGLLRRRLAQELNAETRAFGYASMKSSISANAEALGRFLNGLRANTLHLVGHSLGGLVILKLFEIGAADQLPPGRIVFLGSPLNGSRAALNLARLPLGKMLLGRGVREELLSPRERRWRGQRDLGVIAGSLSVGLGKLVGARGAPNDGTIFVDETRLPGISQHLVLPVSHTGLPFSKLVARQAGAFLQTGKFID